MALKNLLFKIKYFLIIFILLFLCKSKLFLAYQIITKTVNASDNVQVFNLKAMVVGINPEENGENLTEKFWLNSLSGKSVSEIENIGAEKNIAAFKRLSNNTINYEVVKKVTITSFPKYKNGFEYSFQKYQEWGCAISDPTGNCERQKKEFDYIKLFQENNLCQIAEENNVDEIWLMSVPFITNFESIMVGPQNGFWVNGSFFIVPECSKNYIVMNQGYSTLPFMHIYSHRIESTLNYISENWKPEDKQQYISKFLGWDQKTATTTRPYPAPFCGDGHYPSNGVRDYDYNNLSNKESLCPDWKNFPNFNNETISVNCEKWHCTDEGENGWQEYWFSSIPRNDGTTLMTSKTGITFSLKNNWWNYLLYPENAIALKNQTETQSSLNSDCSRKNNGDADCDGDIDMDDLTIWKEEFLTASSTKRSDFNNDNKIDAIDFLIWRQNYLSIS